MSWIVTDTTCGHTVVTARAQPHAAEHARLADLAGYPTTLEEWETVDPDSAPPAGCRRCWQRVAATLHLMNRARVATAAERAGVDPFAAVYAYDELQALHPDLTSSEAAAAVIAVSIPYLIGAGSTARLTAPDAVPDDLTTAPPGPS